MLFFKLYLKYEALTIINKNNLFDVVTKNIELIELIEEEFGTIREDINRFYRKDRYFLILNEDDALYFKLQYNEIIESYEEHNINVHPINPTNN